MRRPWSFLDFVLIWLGGQFGSALLYTLGLAIGNVDSLVLWGFAGQYTGNLIAFWLLFRLKSRPEVGFEVRPGDIGYLVLGLLFQIAMATLVTPLADALFRDHEMPQGVADQIAGADTTTLQIGLILAAVIFAPITEELMFRGVLLRSLEPRGRRLAVVVSALAFAAVHATDLDFDLFWQSALVVLPPIFLLGLVLGWVTQRSGRLGPAIFLHSGWNLLAAFVLLLPKDLLDQVN